MNRFSVVFLAVLLLLSMQKKDNNKENLANVGKPEDQDSEVAVSSDASSEASSETVKNNPSKRNVEEEAGEKLKKSKDKASIEKKESEEEADADKKSKKDEKPAEPEKRTWMDEIKEIKVKEEKIKEVLSKASENAKKDNDDKSYKEAVNDLAQRIIDIEYQTSKARHMLKAFREDVNKKMKKNGEVLEDAIQDSINKAKDEEKYLGNLSVIIKNWKVAFANHFLAICKKNISKEGKIVPFVPEKEGGSGAMFYGGIAVVLCIASFVLGYCFGGRKN